MSSSESANGAPTAIFSGTSHWSDRFAAFQFGAFDALNDARRPTAPHPGQFGPEPASAADIQAHGTFYRDGDQPGLASPQRRPNNCGQEFKMMTKWIAALAAASLAASPAVAQATRTAARVEEADSLRGGNALPWVFAIVMVIGAILILSDDDDDADFPASP
jgi:hypothetical protein